MLNTGLNTYVVNLERDLDRLAWMKEQMKAQRWDFQRFPAVEGKTVSDENVLTVLGRRPENLSDSELGCVLSHIGVWESFLSSTAKFALVLEDDIHMKSDFFTLLESATGAIAISDIAVHRFETHNMRVTLKKKPLLKIGSRTCRELLSNHGGTAAYLINRSTAEYLYENRFCFKYAIDTELFDPKRRTLNELTVYQWLPAPCIQDMHFEYKKNLVSNIAGNRYDERHLYQKQSRRIVEWSKSMMRPIYTFWYDRFLSFSGKTRKDAKFG